MKLDLTLLISLLVAGISRGMIYFLLSAGLTLIFGVLNVINFAHGAFYMLGVFFCYNIAKGLNFWVALIIVPIVMAIIGAMTEFFLFRRIYKATHVMQLLLSVGVVMIITDIIRLVWGVTPKSGMMPNILKGFIDIMGLTIPKYSLFIIGVTSFIALIILLILYRTKIGSVVRACVIDNEMTSYAGINVSLVYLLVFMAGVGLAGLASVMASPIVTASLGMDAQIIIIAFCVVLIGGAGSIGGALVAALIVGVVESLGIIILPGLSEVFIYITVVVVLTFRPSGLFGLKES